jgi:uncharacterized membrane protein YkoI
MGISKRHLLISAIVLGTLTGTIALADSDHRKNANTAPTPATISLTDAIQKVQAAVPGTVVGAELENERGKAVYQVEIASLNKSGETTEVSVDATNGAVLAGQSH